MIKIYNHIYSGGKKNKTNMDLIRMEKSYSQIIQYNLF